MWSWGYVIIGAVAAGLGAFVASVAGDQGVDALVIAGYVMAAVGSIMLSIGVIAVGVKAGNEETRRRT